MNSTPQCPCCSSDKTAFKTKVGRWECLDCEERFDPIPSSFPDGQVVASHSGATASQPKRIFFSYGHDENRELVDRFKKDLERRGHEVWIDYKQIGTWDDWKGSITQGIHDSHMAIAFLSIHSTRDPGVCRSEIAMALHHFGTIYPIMVEKLPLESIPATIAHLQWPDLSRWRELRDGGKEGEFERYYEEKLLEIISRVEGDATRFATECDILRRVLTPSSFDSKFAQHLEGFLGREWCFREFEEWLDNKPDSRVFLLSAGPGFGKSAVAVQLATRYRGAVVGTWFCDSRSLELKNPSQTLCTLAFQLALRWDDYRARLLPRIGLYGGSNEERIRDAVAALAKKNLHDLFETLLAGPLSGLIWREHKLVVILDALDEADASSGRNELAALVAQDFLNLPKWICFAVTSRPNAEVSAHLQRFKPIEISSGDSRNSADLRLFVDQKILTRPGLAALPDNDKMKLAEELVAKSAGMILYLRMVEEGLAEGSLEADRLAEMEKGLPGLYARYHHSFEHRMDASCFKEVQPLLRLLLAAPGPLPAELARSVLGCSKEGIRQHLAILSGFVIENPAGLNFFHNSLGEWLDSDISGRFFTDKSEGRKQLAAFLRECFANREKPASGFPAPFPWENQILDWLPLLLQPIQNSADAEILTDLGDCLRERVRYDDARKVYHAVLKFRKKHDGPDHHDTIRVVNKLGVLSHTAGKYANAEVFYRRALKARQKTPGTQPIDTLKSKANLAALFSDRGDFKKAEPLLRTVVEGLEKEFAPNDPELLTSVNNLGILLLEKDDLEEAEKLLRRVLEGRKKRLGEEHRETLRSMVNLAVLLTQKGDRAGAVALLESALQTFEKTLGEDHPDTLVVVNNLAGLHRALGKPSDAEALHRRALERRRKALGPMHPDTLTGMQNLANILGDLGEIEPAENLYREALSGRQIVLGMDHQETLKCMGNLAGILLKKGEHQEAESLSREALAGYERIFGMNHPKLVDPLRNLSIILESCGKSEEARNHQTRAKMIK